MNVQEKILLEENEIKPNRHAANTLLFAMLSAVIFLVFTELNLFRVEKSTMRPCLYMIIISTTAVQPLGRKLRFASDHRTKYVMVCTALMFCQVLMLVLGQFAELVLLFPVIFSAQYHSKKLCLCALVGTLIMAFVSAPASCLLGFTRVSFYTFLIEACGFSTLTTALENYEPWEYAKLLLLYVSLPRMVIIGALSSIVFSIANLDTENILNRVAATYYSTVDILTGLWNRFSFEKRVEVYSRDGSESLICVYADADELHNLNNREGHTAGDAFLKACAEELKRYFGEECYRIGGDEFVAFTESCSRSEVDTFLNRIDEELARWDYHMSFGVASLTECGSVENTLRLAEERMSEKKKEYHQTHGIERE